MRKPVIVRAEAEADLTQAYQWYEQQVRDLGGSFYYAAFPLRSVFCRGRAKRFHY